jgi:hypothetical protein
MMILGLLDMRYDDLYSYDHLILNHATRLLNEPSAQLVEISHM